jgi:carbonic anhydrase/acetyltransferase-like protein (isoleucine patch superfamily)
MRKFLLLLAVLLPQSLKQMVYRRALGWMIGQGVRIGFSYIDAREVTLKDGARIGHLNVFRRLRRLSLGEKAHVHHSNQIVGATPDYPRAASTFTMEDGSALMGRHYVDCPGTVEIGERTVLGGSETQIWSHTLLVVPGGYEMLTTSVRIGRGVYIGARAVILAQRIPDGAVVAAGSVVNKSFPGQDCRLLIAGNPATVRKRYEGTDPSGMETALTMIPGDA